MFCFKCMSIVVYFIAVKICLGLKVKGKHGQAISLDVFFVGIYVVIKVLDEIFWARRKFSSFIAIAGDES